MKKILLWDMRFPQRAPIRLNVDDSIASAIVRSGVGAAADPAQAGALSSGAVLDPGMLTEVVLQHGIGGTARVFLPYSVVLVGAAAGVLASIGSPIAGSAPGTPTPGQTATLTANPVSKNISATAASGTFLFAIGNVPAGVTPTISPNDGRFKAVSDGAGGWNVVTGASALSAGSVNVTVSATGANGVQVAVTIIAVAAGPAITALAAYTTPNTLANGMNASTPPAFAVATSTAARVVVDVTTPIQTPTWYGIGAAMTDSTAYCLTNYMSQAQRTAFLQDIFGSTNGNCTLLRVAIGDSDFIGHAGGQYAYKTYDDVANDTTLANFDASGDLAYIVPRIKDVLAINPNVRIMATPWTPPAWMKSTNQLYGSNGIFVANATNFTTYAQYFVKYLQFMQAQGISIWAVSAQNEPNVSPVDYPGCIWNPVDLDNFAQNYLRPALSAAGFGSVLILAGDAAWQDSGTFVSRSIATAGVYDGAAYHGYGPNTNKSVKAISDGAVATGKPVLMTEMSAGTSSTVGPVVSNEVDFYAQNFGVQMIANGHNGLIFWNLLLDQQNNPIHGVISSPLGGAQTQGLHGVARVKNDTGALTYNADYWWLKQFSYVRVGAKAVKSTVTGAGIMASAFHNPDNTTFVYLYNPTGVSQSVTVTDAQGKRGTVVTLAAGDQTTVTYPDLAVGAGAAPSAVSAAALAGNAQVALTIKASANGSVVTGIDIYRGTVSGTYGSTPITTLSGNADPFSVGAYSYTDATAANGTQYFYLAVVKSAAGNTNATEVNATPSSGAATEPAHYMRIATTNYSGAATPASTAIDVPNSYIDIAAYINPTTFGPTTAGKSSSIVSQFIGSGVTKTNSTYLFAMVSGGTLQVGKMSQTDTSQHYYPATATVSAADANAFGGLWVRVVINASNVTYNGFAPGTITFFKSQDGITWAQVGTTVTGDQGGIVKLGNSGESLKVGDTYGRNTSDAPLAGKVYKAWAKDEVGNFLYNPDFTLQASGITSFADTSPSPRTWTLANGATLV